MCDGSVAETTSKFLTYKNCGFKMAVKFKNQLSHLKNYGRWKVGDKGIVVRKTRIDKCIWRPKK